MSDRDSSKKEKNTIIYQFVKKLSANKVSFNKVKYIPRVTQV